MSLSNQDFSTAAIPADIWSLLKKPDPPPPPDRWLRWHPAQLEECLAARADALPAPLDADELSELREAHLRWGAGPDSLEALERLGDPAARVIVAGQQPALLAGPLLVLYKTMAAIDLARRLAAAHPELHFIPVFWVASEDHDFDEVRRVYWPGHGGQLEEYLASQGLWKPGQMVGAVQTESLLKRLKEQIDHSTFKTEFGPEVFGLLDEALGPREATIESSFCRLLLRLFAGSGLVLLSPLARWVRRRGAAILRAELDAPGASSRAVIERGQALDARGIPPTLHRVPAAINAFWIDHENRRHVLRLEDSEVHRALPQGDGEDHIDQPPLPLDELRAMLDADPAQFSANVVTRPLIQDSILPTVVQVVGPGEAAYLAQVEAVYAQFGVFAPLRWPRPQVTLIEPRVARNLEKYHLTLEEALAMEHHELLQRILQRDMEEADVHEVELARGRQFGEVEALRAKFGPANPAVDSAFDKLLQAMGKGYAKVNERMLYQRQQDERSLTQALALIQNCLRPNNQAQERLLNPLVPFAINYSLDWVSRLADKIRNDPSLAMQIVDLATLAPK